MIERDRAATDLHADASGHFFATLGFELGPETDDRHRGAVMIDPYLQADGVAWPSMASLLTLADILIGLLASHHTRPRISVTSDLGLRLFAPVVGERVECRARLLKVGRTMSVGDALLYREQTGEVIGSALGTFMASPRPSDVTEGFLVMNRQAAPRARTLAEQVGLKSLAAGVAQLPALRDDMANGTESLQGGLVALLGEAATYSAVAGLGASQHVVDTLEVHYLSAGRKGPFRAVAESLRREDQRAFFRVEVRDIGHDRLIAVIETTTKPLAD